MRAPRLFHPLPAALCALPKEIADAVVRSPHARVLTFKRDARPDSHAPSVTRAGVCRGAREVGAPVPARSEHRVLGAEAVDATVL